MQNTSDILYTDRTKVINIKSEILCREAEDDFFYFNNVNAAYKKLKKAVELTPFHTKSVLLFADVCFVKGLIKEALDLYSRIEKISPLNTKVLSSIANCNYVLGNYTLAMQYIEKAIELLNDDSISLLSQLLEIKINILMFERKYKQAYIAFIQAQNILDSHSLKTIYNVSYEVLEEKINLQKKLKNSNLKIV